MTTLVNDAPVTETPAAASPSKPWYRKPVTWLIAGLFILGAAAALFVIGRPGPSGPAGVLKADGFPVSVQFSKSQLDNLGAFSGSDGQAAKLFVVAAAAGIQGSREEAVVQLTPDGAALIGSALPSLQGSLPQGESAHMTGNYLVLDGSVSALGGTSPTAI